MAKRGEESSHITKVGQNAPDYLQKYIEQDTSKAEMKEHRILPRFKVVQGTASGELADKFKQGDLIARPGDILIAAAKATIQFVPLFFFNSFMRFSDLQDKESPTILEQTYDASSELAKKCRDAERRIELYPGQESKKSDDRWKYRNSEFLNFPGLIYGVHDLAGQPITLSFTRGEFMVGKNFLTNASMRVTPLWSQVYDLSTGHRDRGAKKKWWGIDFAPATEPNIKAEECEQFRAFHDELKKQFADRLLRVDHSDRDDDEDLEVTDGGTAQPSKF